MTEEQFKNSTMFKAAVKILENSGLVIFPTETVYGLAAKIDKPDAIRKIYDIKKRERNKPLSVLVSNKNQVKEVAKIDDELLDRIFENFWPGPLTVVLPKKENVSDLVTAGKETIGVRMPKNKIALSIIEASEMPLATTSVNVSGQEPAKTFEEAMEFKDLADLIIDGGKCDLGVPSTVCEINEGSLKILREGIIKEEELREKLML